MIDKKVLNGKEVSLLGLGTMRLPCIGSVKRESNSNINYDEAEKLVDLAIKSGVNYFDTAYMYHCGKSEEFIGKALSKYPRDSYYLADKLPIWLCDKPSDMQRIFNEQLNRCGVDYFDFYLLHSLDEENIDKCEKFGAYQFALNLKQQGKIKNLGFSFHGTVDDLTYLVNTYEWDFAQIQYNYLDYENQNAKRQYDILTNDNIPIIVMEPVRGGKLADLPNNASQVFKNYDNNNSIASWAIKFVASHNNVLTILSGMNNEAQLFDNINSLTDFQPLNNVEKQLCFDVAKIINKTDLIPCTGCDYCIDCPMEVKISTVFSLYNDYKSSKISKVDCLDAYKCVKNNHLSCIGCGKCKTVCPQGIDIPNLMDGAIKIFFQ